MANLRQSAKIFVKKFLILTLLEYAFFAKFNLKFSKTCFVRSLRKLVDYMFRFFFSNLMSSLNILKKW